MSTYLQGATQANTSNTMQLKAMHQVNTVSGPAGGCTVSHQFNRQHL